ncbi:tRNA (N(6)-L-threonylcarbamoyladenosine(37)-C(2))-methylthiotransferase MtaB [Syntrophomonas palmitatica]|uniref:tRNA (N(6)-L-threonylcarbamoyladenosine(37)-C(2))- methylthiotransferase MtaB n=1 Tax=Syntrophomonas palmitatica TaxID=402877 RepID=UPI0006D1F922|nr:tRNA (N(6)-L-threonylcarbamoyladenosine(37)-C(2))-methylthiotransferase MtaB [Syntrophomonas palmitatica]
MKNVAFYTLGCKVNQVESEQLKEIFIQRGYRVVEPGEPANVYVVNTCTVTHVSDRKSRAVIRRIARRNLDAIIAVTGCMAQLDPEALADIPGVNLVIGSREKENLVDIVEEYISAKTERPIVCTRVEADNRYLKPVIFSSLHERTRAFVKIQDGCQSFCSYCIVPYVRGKVRSKLPEDVLGEVRQLVSLGYREIVITGIHTGQYGLDLIDWDLHRLLVHILHNVEGDYRLRLSSIEPLEMKDELIELMRMDKRICPHFHIPLQSGSDRILKLMHRRYDRSYYMDLIRTIAASLPRASFTSDVMVGFPGESEADFQQTIDLLLQLPLLDLHVFKYSPRPGTPAADFAHQVKPEIKQARSETLLELARTKHDEFIIRFMGEEFEVLVEREVNGFFYGFTENYIETAFCASQNLCGGFARIKLTGINGPVATAELV